MFKKHHLYPLFTLMGILVFGEYFYIVVDQERKKEVSEHIESLSLSFAQAIQREIAIATSSTFMLETMVKIANYDVSQFDDWAKQILTINNSLSVLQLAPNGIVTYSFPIEGHEKAIGHDLFADNKRHKGASKAMRDESLTFVGPLRLMQNGRQAVIARKPIFKQNPEGRQFWGFATALIYTEVIVDNALDSLQSSTLKYKLFGNDPDANEPVLIAQSASPITENAKRFALSVPNCQWTLWVDYEYKPEEYWSLYHFLVVFLAIALAIVAFKSEYRSYQLRKKLNQLASLDPLTGLLNRRCFHKIAQDAFVTAQKQQQPFCVAMLDLDHFKYINDTYGHDSGDDVLKEFVHVSLNACRAHDTLARWGGEEFVLLMPNTDINQAKVVCDRLNQTLSQSAIFIAGDKVELTVSIGISQYALNDQSANEVLTRADKALYSAKDEGRDCCKIYRESML